MDFKTRVLRLMAKQEIHPPTVARVYRKGKHVEDIISQPDGTRQRRKARKAR